MYSSCRYRNNLTLPTPASATTYYVRFEGDCNTTPTVSVMVNITETSVAPASASVDRNNLCPADGNLVLSYAGGSLGSGATAEWYSDAGFTTMSAPAITYSRHAQYHDNILCPL